jgi:acetolactate synthase-1/2/3 large subunit/sulfoacetaldehyde acetyltransferase
MKISGGQAIVESLKTENVKYVFGLIGSATMEVFDALYDAEEQQKLKFIGVRDERAGVHMADGYARASDLPGVILAGQNGPGATNLTTGLAQAAAAYSPVISLAGSLSLNHQYRNAFQEVDQQALFTPITKKTWSATQVKRLPEMMREAFRVALSPRQGPVHLNLPRDVLSQEAEIADFQAPSDYRGYHFPAASEESINQVIQLLQYAKKPVIIAGGGLKNDSGQKALITLAESLQIPVTLSPGHGDVMPFDHPLTMGQMGPRGNPVASELVKQADVILTLGTRLGFNSTFYSYDNINAKAKIIQVEIEPTAIGRYFPTALGIWADVIEFVQQLTERWQKNKEKTAYQQWHQQAIEDRKNYLSSRDQQAQQLLTNEFIQPASLFWKLRQTLPKNAAITMDAGTLCLQATDALNYGQSKSLFTPLDFGLVGFSFACGLGVKLAQPERPVISLMGDGGFGMTIADLSTAVSYGINTITIVMNNQCWGAEKAYQRDFFNERYIGADIQSPPFDKVAQLYGASGFKAQSLDELQDVLKVALENDKPSVIDVSVDPKALYSFRRDSFTHRTKK